MKHKKQKVGNVPNRRTAPLLRFREFTELWNKTTLGECSDTLDYGMNAAAKEYDGLNKYIRITDIDEITNSYKSDNPVSPDGKLDDKYLVDHNDILFARTGASTGKSYLYKERDGRLYFAGFLIRVKIKHYCNANFIFCQTQTNKYRKWVKLMSMRSGQPGINSQEFSSFSFYMPQKKEQDKIAALLNTIDERITIQIKLIQQLETLMLGLREKLFTQKIKFKDKDGNDFPKWKTERLNQLATISTGSSNRIDSNLDGEFTFFDRSQDIRTSSKFLFDKEAVIVPGEGKEFVPKYFIGKFDLHQRTYAIFDFKNILGKYLFYFIVNSNDYLKAYAVGSTVKSLRLPIFQSMLIGIPSMEEQSKIAGFLTSLSDKIENEKNLLAQYEQQKKYLLQQLFV
jgi:type I restriction enzyme S subunit